MDGLAPDERAGLEAVEGIVFDVQRYSLHDGPGLRTNIFFKGCPLRCGWCCNPESQEREPQPAVFANDCIRCGQFEEPCPATWPLSDEAERRARYGPRAALCPAGAVRMIGERRTAGSLLAEALRDVPFYEGGGGVTLTGGEPLLQPRLAQALLRLARAEGIHTAIETSGYASWAAWESLLPYLDAILFDVKQIDSRIHRSFTGVGNERILANLRRLVACGAPVTVRVPLIPGFNATERDLQAIADLVLGLSQSPLPVDLLPYHTLGRAKYRALARIYPWESYERLSDARVEALAEAMRSRGVSVTIGG